MKALEKALMIDTELIEFCFYSSTKYRHTIVMHIVAIYQRLPSPPQKLGACLIVSTAVNFCVSHVIINVPANYS